jgi:hypothetical protein
MLNSFRILAVAALLLTLGVGAAMAGNPDPNLSTVPNVVVSPNGALAYQVDVQGSAGAIEGALVVLRFTAEANGFLCWCAGQDRPEISSITDAAGLATFNIQGGGCLDPAALGAGFAVEVFADGILLDEVGVVSSDAADDAGVFPPDGWNPGGTCAVGLSDASIHTTPISGGAYAFCTDINSDLAVDLVDAVILTPQISGGASCGQ